MTGESGGYAGASDGTFEVDSNTGTPEEIAAELSSEVGSRDEAGRLVSSPAAPAADAGDPDDEDADAQKPAGAAAAIKPGADAKTNAGKKRSLQARIDDITRERYTTVRERDAAIAERDALKARLEALEAGGRPADKEPAAKPAAAAAKVGGVSVEAEKFPKYAEWLQAGNDGELEDWVDARDTWKESKKAKADEASAEQRDHSARFTKTAATFNERMAPVLKADPEFYEKIDPRLTETPASSALPKGVKPTFGNFLVEQVVRSEYPKDLLIHLSKPKVIQRLMTLQPDEVLRDLMRFEIGLGTPAAHLAGPAGENADEDDDEDDTPPSRSAAAATATSRAQPPAKPVRGSSHEHSSPDDEPGEDASDDDWYRWEKRRTEKAPR